jgi:hypothetical protein
MRRLFLGLAIVAALAGCGDDGTEVHYLNTPAVITQAQVDRQPEGSPQRTVVEWARAVVFNDPFTVAALYSPKLEITPDKVNVPQRGATGFSTLRSFRIGRVARQGRDATVVGKVHLRIVNTDKRFSLAFQLERRKGRWLFSTLLPLPVQG